LQKNLLASIATRLKRLDSGGYARVYRKGIKMYSSSLHLLIADILDAIGIRYNENQKLSSASLIADFSFGDTVILIEKELSAKEKKSLQQLGKKCIVVTRIRIKSDVLDTGIRIFQVEDSKDGRMQTIFLDDPSFNFDYAHILPQTEKCSVMHGHTSSALVEIIGSPINGMVVDFNDAKPIIREAIRELDHKLFINDKYVVSRDNSRIELEFSTIHGNFHLKVPKSTTVLLDGEATVENLAQELLNRISVKMPENVEAVGVYVYEGLNKGTHLLAQIHRREAEKLRKKQ
jgi:6-pyruvoyltetrahydropterin/6-carboxytetrahydropterin synthase